MFSGHYDFPEKTLRVSESVGRADDGYCIKSEDLHKDGFLELRGQARSNKLPGA
jgi:hypothetical protein